MVNNMPTRPVRNANSDGGLIRQLEQLKKELDQLKALKDSLGAENEQLKEKINEYEQRIQALEENNASASQAEIEVLNKEIERLNKLLEGYQTSTSSDNNRTLNDKLNYFLQQASDKQRRAGERIVGLQSDLRDQGRKLNNTQAERDAAQAQRDAAQAQRDAAQAQRDAAQAQRDAAQAELGETNPYDRIYRIILETMNDQYDKYISLDDIDSYKNKKGLYKAVIESQKEHYGSGEILYDLLVGKMVERIDKLTISTEKKDKLAEDLGLSKDYSTKDIVQAIIDSKLTSYKASHKKRTIGYVLAGVGTVVLAGVIALASVYGGQNVDLGNKLVNTESELEQSKGETILAQLNAEIQPIITSNDANYDTIQTNYNNATTLYKIYSAEDTTVQSSSAATKSVSIQGDFSTYYSDITTAKEEADSTKSLNDTAVTNYTTAYNTGDYANAQKYGEEIKGYSTSLQTNLDTSNISVSSMLESVGITMDEFASVLELVNNPVTSIEFSANNIKSYNSYLTNGANGGTAKEVLSCQYTKATGGVVLLVKCQGRKGDYINMISYNIDKELTLVGDTAVQTVMSPLVNDSTQTKSVAFNKEMNVNEGNVKVIYNVTPKAIGSSMTGYSGSALAYQVDENGEIKILTTVSVNSKSYDNGADATAEKEVCEELLNKINLNSGLSLEIIAGEENELE